MTTKVAYPEFSVLVETEVVDDSESEPEIEESGLKVFAELAPLQEEISSWSTEVEELPIETLLDLPVELTTNLVPSLAAMRASLSLRSLDVYDLLQIILQEAGSQEIWLFMM